MSCESAIFEQLRARGFRLTPQREMVLSVMHGLDDFATAEEIFDGVRALSSAVDISTIYRTLDLLQNFHVVATVDPGDGQRRYRLSGVDGSRLYLVCRACGGVRGVELEPVLPLLAFLRESLGFEVDLDHLSVPGLCQGCRAGRDQVTRAAG
jgi:Fur family ferric uptake transcriptional regulator